MVTKVGQIKNVDGFVEWCESKRNLLKKGNYKSDYKRLMLPIGYQATIEKEPKFIKVNEDERMNKFVSKYCPNWKLSLLCLYGKGGGINLHRDSTGYGIKAYGVSSVDYEFIHNGKSYDCKAGVIYRFNSKQPHKVPTVKQERWALLWWEPDWKFWNQQFNQ